MLVCTQICTKKIRNKICMRPFKYNLIRCFDFVCDICKKLVHSVKLKSTFYLRNQFAINNARYDMRLCKVKVVFHLNSPMNAVYFFAHTYAAVYTTYILIHYTDVFVRSKLL